MIIVSEASVARAWLAGAEQLQEKGGDAFTTITGIRGGADDNAVDIAIRRRLDAFLLGIGAADTQTVANTIFPEPFLSRSAEEAARRYEARIWPVIRRVPANRRGTYFRRLSRLESNGSVSNPLGDMIGKMRSELARRGSKRCAYELAVFRPESDARMLMGFPCLSHVSFSLDGNQVHLTALYRNQFFIRRLFGNLLGLRRLQQFVAHHTDTSTGDMVCHASHAAWGPGVTVRKLNRLLSDCRRLLDGSRTDTARLDGARDD